MKRWIGIALALSWIVSGFAAETEEQQKLNTAIEALTRLQNVNLEEKPAIKAAVGKVLEKSRGTPGFVKLVRHFNLTNQNAGLLEVAARNPSDESGVEAMRLILAGRDLALIQSGLQTTNTARAVSLIEVLGYAKEKQTVTLLSPLLAEERLPAEVRRAAVRALVQTQDGATALLTSAREGKLPDNLKFLASSELQSVRWPEIKRQAAEVLPLPAGQNARPLPPVSELVRMKGDVARGAEIFRRETAGCIKCHQVRGEGRDVGPALSEIGNKLPKEALLEAILDPSAGISFGFEGWQLELKSGDEAYGIKASETPAEVAIKDPNGIVTRYKKSDVASMQMTKTSLMPAGLQSMMTAQELADLLEYLASLKK